MLNVFIVVGIIIIICLLIKLIDSKNVYYDSSKPTADADYRRYIFKNASPTSKSSIKRIFDEIDKINRINNQYEDKYNQAVDELIRNIYNKVDEVENQIRRCWNDSRFNKDFSFYIGLHYSSHLLGDALKSEQHKIKNAFVKCKKEMDNESRNIDELQRRQGSSSGKRKAEIGQQIANCCKIHKSYSNLSHQLGAINDECLKRCTSQNIKTAERRDYIATHFGERGRRWKKRLRLRAGKNTND
jgi:hypothetical protein